MQPISLCPQGFSTGIGCPKQFCHYKNKKGECSLDFEPESREYEVGEIAEALQVSRQRIWRLYDIAIAKLQKELEYAN